MPLSARQEKFCVEYAKSANATESYRKAGYKAKNDNVAKSAASRLLSNVDVKARIAELADEVRKQSIMDIAEIQELLSSIARGEIKEDQIVVEGCGDGISQAVNCKREAQLKDRIKAAETLAKMRGGFDNTININVEIPRFVGDDELED